MARPKSLRSEIAEALGITPTVVSKYWKRGMPRDSIEDAVRWHFLNVKKNTRAESSPPPKKKVAKEAPVKIQNPKSLAVPDAPPKRITEEVEIVEDMENGDGLKRALSKLGAEARFLDQKMGECRNDQEEAKYYRSELIATVEQIRKIEVVWQKIQKEKEESILVEDAKEGIEKCVGKLLTFLDRLPMRATKSLTGAERSKAIAGIKEEITKAQNELFDFKTI